MIKRCCNACTSGKPCRHQRGNRTGDNCRIMHHPNGNDFHREHYSSQRCAEQSRKPCRHAAHRHYAFFPFIQLHFPAEPRGDAAAQLERRAFPAGRAAKQVRHNGTEKNQRCSPNGNGNIGANCYQYKIGAFIVFHMLLTICQHNQQAAKRQKPEYGRVSGTEYRRPLQSPMEGDTRKTHEHTYDRSRKRPAQKSDENIFAVFRIFYEFSQFISQNPPHL